MSPHTTSPALARILLMRRLVYIIPAVALTLAGWALAWEMIGGFTEEGPSALNIASFAVFTLLFAMLAFTSWAAFLGLGLWLLGRRNPPIEKEALAIPLAHLRPSKTTRTAILIPAYHEDAHEVFARVRTMRASLAALQPKRTESDIDIFVLSDSQNADSITAEAEAYKNTVAAMPKHGPSVFYRRRESNIGYKVGNIKEFCQRWGHAYEHMLMLDADSLMSGETIRRMILTMERNPKVGLLQTCFIPINRETLFCRVMQFSTRLYLMPAAMGLEFWQGANGNFWGHNALVRTKAFLQTCGLPELPGKAPLGGRILSHDIVEAAFLARGGWQAWLLPNMPGTYEELPTNLVDFMQRDRRWCAGNLQHQHIIRAHGVQLGNRWHMILGIMSYVTGPLWMAFILLALLAAVFGNSGGMQLATAGYFATTEAASDLFWLTMALLFVPKVATITLAMLRPSVRKSFGGGARLMASAVLEQIFTMVQQPTVMLFYSNFVIRPLLGSVVKWEAQPRSERGISWKEGFLRHKHHMLFGVGLVILMLAQEKTTVMVGLIPVLVGLFLSPAFTVFTSRASLGQTTRRMGLFLTQDELTPCPTVQLLHKNLAQAPKAAPARFALPALPTEARTIMPIQLLRYPPATQPVPMPAYVKSHHMAFEKLAVVLIITINVGRCLISIT